MDLLSSLVEIGFTEYEAKVYLALLRESPATGYQVSKKSGVPRSMVYDALSRLHARGAVLETVEGRATQYRPLPPDLLITRHEEEHTRLLGSLRDGLDEMYTGTEEEGVWSISGQPAVISYAAQLIRQAESDLSLVLSDEDVKALRPEVEGACARGIAVSALLTGEEPLGCGREAHHPPLESEMQGLTGTLLVVADNREALIASSNHEMTGSITTNRNLVLIARQFVWMELFTQRVYARLGPRLLDLLDDEDRRIFESAVGGGE